MCIRDRRNHIPRIGAKKVIAKRMMNDTPNLDLVHCIDHRGGRAISVSYTHLRAHETVLDLVCRLLLEKKNSYQQ